MNNHKKFILIFSLSLLFFNVPTTKAAIIDIETSTFGGMKKISFTSDCSIYTTKTSFPKSGTSGVTPNPQLKQNIYYNESGSGDRDIIWFQHGDGGCSSAPRKKCESSYFKASDILTHPNNGQNQVLFCPETNPSGTDSCYKHWSKKYAEFFPCLYDDFREAFKQKSSLDATTNVIFASHSQGGPATYNITINPPSNVNIKKIVHFDSCYSNYCLNEAVKIPVEKRGPILTYASNDPVPPETCPGSWCGNAYANQKATIDKKIYEQPNVASYLLPDSDHGEVPTLCKTAVLDDNPDCNGKAQLAGSSGISSVTVDTGIPFINEVKLILNKPTVQIKIPGLSFSENILVEENGDKYIIVPFLGEYLAALYRYSIVVASILAVIIIIISGIQWTISGGSPEKITDAKKRIMQSIVGLLLAVGSYTLLFMINPELVQFRNLKVQTVKGITLNKSQQLLLEYGSDSGLSLFSPTSIKPGELRSKLVSTEVCGDKNGMSLTTYKERIEKLIPIVNAWKIITFDQGGGIYSRGGKFDCGIDQWKEIDYQYKKLGIIYNSYPELFNTSTDRLDPCFKVVIGVAQDIATNTAQDKRKNPEDLMKEYGLETKKCLPLMNKVLNSILHERAGPAGLMCADCGYYLLHMHRLCFDNKSKALPKRIKARGCPDDFGKYLFKFNLGNTTKAQTNSKVEELIKKLNFGDIIAYRHSGGGHYLMYTGKAGLDFEVLDMGNSNTSKTTDSNAGIRLATKNIGLPELPWSGVGAYESAKDYLKRVMDYAISKGRKEQVFCAYRPLDDSYFNN